jgi:hypothetical protein
MERTKSVDKANLGNWDKTLIQPRKAGSQVADEQCGRKSYAPQCEHLLLISAVHFLTSSCWSVLSFSNLANMPT